MRVKFKGMTSKQIGMIIVMVSSLLMVQCHKYATQDDINKIQFNYSAIENNGFRNEGVSVDYEFCIPAKESYGKKVLRIEPQANIMEKSKGRSGCTDQQWLVVINNHDANWKNKLFAMTSLPFVERIRQTDYE